MRRRKPPEPVTPDGSGVPAMLALGACAEVFGHDGTDLIGARRAWHDARDEWAEQNGLDPDNDYRHLPPVLYDHAPWSFARMAEQYPGWVAGQLARAGLPPGWTP